MISRPGRAAVVAALVAAALAGTASGPAAAAEPAFEDPVPGPPPPEPSGYKMDDYRSATPLTLQGARAVDTAQAEALWREKGAVFLDTMPRDRHPPNLPPGTVWRDKPRDHIPGSAWLANVGYGALTPEMDAYFQDALKAVSANDMSKPLLFYCRAACWMSWNAAKHAMALGYANVIWYAEGTDGWSKAGLPLERASPYVLAPASQ
jgi:PQQ-dependent catabolism-associated CXXCW motif protein